MRNGEIRKKTKLEGVDSKSDLHLGMDFLLEATMDRSAYDSALASIRPLSEFQDIIGKKMPNTAAAIRKCINNVNSAIAAKPDMMMQLTAVAKLSKPQQQLLDAITSSEILKFSILNAMDAVRMLLITDFEKSAPYYDDEVIVFDVKARGMSQQVMVPQRVPFSKIKELGSYEVYDHSTHLMVVGKESSNAGQTIKIPIRGTAQFIDLHNVPVGKIYLAGRDPDGRPSPVPLSTKRIMLNVKAPAADSSSVFDKTISKLSEREDKKFDLNKVVKDNFTIPTEAEGIVTSIWRALKQTQAFKPSSLSPSTFAAELGQLTLLEFKKYYEALVARTSNATGDMSTFDLADSLFFTGLAAVTGMLGIAPPPGPSGLGGAAGASGAAGAAGAAGASGAAGAAGAAGAGGRGAGGPGGAGGGGGGGGGGTVNRSLSNFLNTTNFIKGSNPAEKAANKASLDAIIDRDAMRRELNLFAGGSNLVFTESVDRWCKLAGIKEKK